MQRRPRSRSGNLFGSSDQKDQGCDSGHLGGEKWIPLEPAHTQQGCDRISIYANTA
jgi:hypothetical protein